MIPVELLEYELFENPFENPFESPFENPFEKPVEKLTEFSDIPPIELFDLLIKSLQLCDFSNFGKPSVKFNGSGPNSCFLAFFRFS